MNSSKLSALLLYSVTYCACSASDCTSAEPCPPSSLSSLPRRSQYLGSNHSPHCFLKAPASTDLCGLSVWHSGLPITSLGWEHCLPILGIHLERCIPLLHRYCGLNCRAPSAMPVAFSPQILGALFFFVGFIAFPSHKWHDTSDSRIKILEEFIYFALCLKTHYKCTYIL